MPHEREHAACFGPAWAKASRHVQSRVFWTALNNIPGIVERFSSLLKCHRKHMGLFFYPIIIFSALQNLNEVDFIFIFIVSCKWNKKVHYVDNIFIKVQYGIYILLHVRLPTLSCTLLMDDFSNRHSHHKFVGFWKPDEQTTRTKYRYNSHFCQSGPITLLCY